MRVAQVTAKLGETVVDIAYVAPGERFTIGTARGVQLAIAGVREFPLVTSEARGFVVRRPVGLGTLVVDDKELVLSWSRVTLELGLVTIELELVERSGLAVPRPELHRRTPAFVVASLIVHLLVWGAAITFGHLPRAKKPPAKTRAHPLVVHLAPLPPPPSSPQQPPPATSSPQQPVPPNASSAASRATAIASRAAAQRVASPRAADAGDRLAVDENGNASMGDAMARLAAAMPNVGNALDQVGPLYIPSAVDNPFGDVAKLDPKTRPGWGSLTITTGRYRTISHGPGAGDDVAVQEDPIPASQGLALCESRRCEVTGGLAKEAVQEVAATRGPALEKCAHRGAVLLELDISPDGQVKKVRGAGTAARCAAAVIASLAFPAAETATHATFTIGYP